MVSRPALTAGVFVRRLLDVVWFTVLAGGAIVAVVIVVVLARGGHPRVVFPVALTVRGAAVVGGATGSARVAGVGGQMSVEAPTTVVTGVLIFSAAGVGFMLVVIGQLRALLAETVAGSPFGAGSVRRVRLIGAAIIAAGVTRGLVVFVGSLWARAHVQNPEIAFRLTFPLQLGVLAAGVLVVMLAEVYRVGVALQQDHDLTI